MNSSEIIQLTVDLKTILQYPLINFMNVLSDLSEDQLKELKELEEKTFARERYIKIIDAQLNGSTCVIDEKSEEDEIILKNGMAFVFKDGEEVPYTSKAMEDREIERQRIENSPERKKRAMELL